MRKSSTLCWPLGVTVGSWWLTTSTLTVIGVLSDCHYEDRATAHDIEIPEVARICHAVVLSLTRTTEGLTFRLRYSKEP